MKLIVGLGNPGKNYASNRHNVGYQLIDALEDISLPHVILRKTGVFMNSSGSAIKRLLAYCRVPSACLYVAHDDLDLPLGTYKIQFAKGPKVHQGLLSIENELGTDQFWHIRIGVDNRNPQDPTPGDTYVLQDFTPEEQQIAKQVIAQIITDLKTKNYSK